MTSGPGSLCPTVWKRGKLGNLNFGEKDMLECRRCLCVRRRPRRHRKIVVVLGFVLSLAVLAGQRALQGSSPQSTQQPPRTLEELARSDDMILAASTIEYSVGRLHQDWDMLPPLHRDTLCRAGKAIRSLMHANDNTVADLNHAQRAIYDITEPPGRCRRP